MKKVSIRSNAYSEWVGFFGSAKVSSFPCEWDATEWLTVQVEAGQVISDASKLTLADVKEHMKKTR